MVILICCFHGIAMSQQSLQRVLVFSKTEGGYRHASIAAGKMMFLKMADDHKIKIDTTEDSKIFTDQNLKQYQVIVFLSTRGDVLDTFQQAAFQNYIHNGGGFVGIHAATTTEYTWPWYNQLIGAWFDGHPEPQRAFYSKVDSKFYPTANFPDTLTWMDEIYNFRSIRDSLHYVVTVNESSYKGGKMGTTHPIAWYQTFEGGRVFYTGMGHFDEAYTNPLFVDMIYRGLEWASGKNK